MSDFKQGVKHYENKEYKEAIPFFEKNKHANARNYLGFAYLKLDDLDKALFEFEQGWMYFEEHRFVDNMLYVASLYLDKKLNVRTPEHILRGYVTGIHNTYKMVNVYTFLGLLADKEPFNEDKTLEYFEKALALDTNNEISQNNINYIKEKIDKSISGKHFVIKPEIIAILDSLKKTCQIITRFYGEEIETDDEGIYVFGLNNNKDINLPDEIKRLEITYMYENMYEASYKLKKTSNNPIKDIAFENSYNLPDFETLKQIYPKEHAQLEAYFSSIFPEGDFYYDKEIYYCNAYDQLVKKYLGHDLPITFIGGNINQAYVSLYDYKNYNFLMQYQTDWGNGEIFFVFNTKENPTELIIKVEH